MSFKVDVDTDDSILARLSRLEQSIRLADRAAIRAAEFMKEQVIENLRTQGRGGEPPPLSEMTRKIYDHVGEPDGSGLRDHLEISYQRVGRRKIATLGLPPGKPTTVAIVQNDGATIAVTEKMRGYLSAALGIHLKASTTHIVVPGRHFWDLAYKSAATEFKAELNRIFTPAKK